MKTIFVLLIKTFGISMNNLVIKHLTTLHPQSLALFQ
jgi:hypothetical protein